MIATLRAPSLRYLALGLSLGTLALVITPATAASASRSSRPNLVLLTLDTTRADHLGAWGWKWAKTPNLDRLAKDGVRFARVDTAAPLTLPSHASILTGLYPPRTGVRDNGIFTLPSRITTLAERLEKVGYDRAAVVSSVILARRYGLDQGFRIYNDDMGPARAPGTIGQDKRSATAATDAALGLLSHLGHPFFLWVHYYDPHAPYDPPPGFRDLGGPSPLYDGEISYMDHEIGRLIAHLPHNSFIIVVADHGEMLGEHGEEHHGLLPLRAARRVPLLVRGPNVPRDKIISCLVRTIDITPTFLQAAGLPVPTSLDGEPLQPLWEKKETDCDRASYSEAFLPFFSYHWYPLRTLTVGRWLYLQAPTPSLFDESSDPGETKDLARAQPRIAREMQMRLRRLLGAMGESLEPALEANRSESSEERRQLESLGYLSGAGGGQVTTQLPDPRQRTAEAMTIQNAQDLIAKQQCGKVLVLLTPILRRDPNNPTALNYTTYCLLAAQRYDQALALAERAQRLAPRSPAPWVSIARAHEGRGHTDLAKAAYRRALAIDPGCREAAMGLARLFLSQGSPGEAVKTLDQLEAVGASDARTVTERGLAHAAEGDLGAALGDFQHAAQMAPSDPLPLENSARVAFKLRRFAVAAKSYESLLKLEPENAGAWATLAGIYDFKLGDRPNAVRAYTKAIQLAPPGANRQKLLAARARLESGGRR